MHSTSNLRGEPLLASFRKITLPRRIQSAIHVSSSPPPVQASTSGHSSISDCPSSTTPQTTTAMRCEPPKPNAHQFIPKNVALAFWAFFSATIELKFNKKTQKNHFSFLYSNNRKFKSNDIAVNAATARRKEQITVIARRVGLVVMGMHRIVSEMSGIWQTEMKS